MKKIIGLILSAGLLVACNDFLTVPLESSISTSNFYSTPEEFELGLTGVYSTLRTDDWASNARYGSYFQGLLTLTRVGTDEMFAGYDIYGGEVQLSDYTYTTSSIFLSRTWFVMYQGIQRANIIIDRIASVEMDDASKARISGEAHFLRAFFYFHLVRLFGEVPLVVHETTDLSLLNTKRKAVAEVYKQITEDLLYAKEHIPEGAANGHASREAATAMLGKVYLQMSGYPLYDQEAASKALAELTEVKNNPRFALESDYFALFDGEHEYGPEYIWDIEFANNGTTFYGGQVGTLEGVPSEAYMYWTSLRAVPDLLGCYEDADIRKGNFAQFQYVYDSSRKLVEKYPEDGEEALIYHSFALKFRHPLDDEKRKGGWANWANPINFPIIRYADVLLMYAEASARANGSVQPDALEAVNMVRRRGYGLDVNTASAVCDISASSKEDFLAKILLERKLELCFEGQRWYDLQRYDQIKEALESCTVMIEAYPSYASNFQEKHKFYPIPQDVIDASEGKITQSELWK